MPTLSGLFVYPIKSCQGIALDQALFTEYGIAWDRHWMVADHAGNFLTQRTHPLLATIQTALTSDTLQISAAHMSTLSIPLAPSADSHEVDSIIWRSRVRSLDEGDEVAAWFSQILNDKVRLLRFAPDYKRVCDPQWTQNHTVHTQFADGFPVLIASTASLADLNQRLRAEGAQAIPMNRFRPNVVIDGLEAYDEDFIDTLQIGDVQLKCIKPCARCSVPSVDQSRGVSTGDEPLATLSTYRMDDRVGGATLGQNAFVLQGVGKSIHKSAEVRVELNF